MLKLFTTLCFAIAAVAGDWATQDHGQNQLRFPVQPPQTQIESGPVLSPQSVLPVTMPRARPCQRRSFGNPTVISPDFVPVTQQRFGSQLVQPQLKAQSLTENRTPATDDNNEEVKFPHNAKSPYKSMEKNSNQSNFSENHSLDDGERKRDIQDSLESYKAEQNNAPHVHTEDDHYHHHQHSNSDASRVDSHEKPHDSHECETNAEADQYENHDESEHNSDDTSKKASNDVHDQVIKLISKCVQEATAEDSEENVHGESRRFNSLPDSQHREDVSSKLKPINNFHRNEESKSNRHQLEADTAQDRLDPQLYNPAKDARKLQSNPKVSLLQNGRVCYACSTYFDPSCWKPNATTTVKYCYKNNNACITRTFKVGEKTILTRDCGNTCNEDNPYGVGPRHKTCSMCHYDMCNSAFAVHGLNWLIVTFVISTVKFTLQ